MMYDVGFTLMVHVLPSTIGHNCCFVLDNSRSLLATTPSFSPTKCDIRDLHTLLKMCIGCRLCCKDKLRQYGNSWKAERQVKLGREFIFNLDVPVMFAIYVVCLLYQSVSMCRGGGNPFHRRC